jgi:5-methylcytosine-specific restriction endonuclease McrA
MMESVLVLNFDYTPLNITTIQRGVVLVYKGKAEIVREHENPLSNGLKNYVRPLVIRLLSYINFFRTKNNPNRSKIYKRDNHTCVYCGSTKNLTLDHVIPRSRGGTNEWTNLVTSCFNCNLKKGNRTPEEAKMVLSHKPYKPDYVSAYFQYDKILEGI